jgi:hypothetical protein
MRKRYREKRPKRLGAMADRQTETSPSFTRILHRHGLCPADLPPAEAFDLYTRIGSDPVVLALKPRAILPKTNQLAVYTATERALAKLTAAQKQSLLGRLQDRFRL